MTYHQQKAIWDQKAPSFRRFEENDTEAREILDFFASYTSFQQKRVFDIGCGNGRITLHIARQASQVHALDISHLMLEILQKDAREHHLSNLITHSQEWLTFNLKDIKAPDIVFASMTPALNNKEAFKKALRFPKQALCYVGWGRLREAEFLSNILQAHGVRLELPTGLPNVLEWLTDEKITPHFTYKTHISTHTENITQAIKNIKWHIQINGGCPDDQLVEQYILTHQCDHQVTYTQTREIGLAYIPLSD